jgi:hypothetical protein
VNQAGATEVVACEGTGGKRVPDVRLVSVHADWTDDLPYLRNVDIDNERLRPVNIPNAIVLDKGWAMPECLDKEQGKVDVVMSLGKPRVHAVRMTGTIKNWIGIGAGGWCGGGSGGMAIYSKATRAATDALPLAKRIDGQQHDSPVGRVGGGLGVKMRNHGYAWVRTFEKFGREEWDQGAQPNYVRETADLCKAVPIDMAWHDCSTATEIRQSISINSDPASPQAVGGRAFRVDWKERTGNHWVVASYDPVASDVAAYRMCGWSEHELLRDGVASSGLEASQLYWAHHNGLGQNDPRGVEFKGVDTLPETIFIRQMLRRFATSQRDLYKAFPPKIHPDFEY